MSENYGEWIPVTERLPEDKDRRVLTWDGHAHSLTAVSHRSHWMQVTHWCYIPEGPAGGR